MEFQSAGNLVERLVRWLVHQLALTLVARLVGSLERLWVEELVAHSANLKALQ